MAFTPERSIPASTDAVPADWPCERWGTAKYTRRGEHVEMDCELTRDAGECPWEKQRPDVDPMSGGFHNPCSLNVTWANSIVAYVAKHTGTEPPVDFTGGTRLEGNPNEVTLPECRKLRKWMTRVESSIPHICEQLDDIPAKALRDRWRYLEWWTFYTIMNTNGWNVWP